MTDTAMPIGAVSGDRTATYRKLRVFNVVVGLILGAEAALMLALSNGLALPVYALYLRNDPVKLIPPRPEEIFSIAIGPAIALLLFFSFALNLVLQYRQVGRWRDYVGGETTYILLSLTAKSLLAWLIFANVLRT